MGINEFGLLIRDIITILLQFIGRAVCHQLPSRSFFLADMPLPLCSRCTGMYIAVFVCTAWILILKRQNGNKPLSVGVSIFVSVCFLPLVIDGVTSYLNIRETNNFIRFFTGILFAASFPEFFILLKNFRPEKINDKYIIKHPFEQILIIIVACMPLIPMLIGGMVSWFFIAIVLSFAVFLPFYGVARILCRFVFRKNNCRFYHYFSLGFSMITVMIFSVLHRMLISFIV